MPRSPGHMFYDRLQMLLGEAGFDVFVEETSKPFYAPRMGTPSLPHRRRSPAPRAKLSAQLTA
jgi:transposase